MRVSLFTVLLFLLLNSCEVYDQDDYEEYYVVESYLVAENQLPTIYLSTTGPVEEKYHWGGKSKVNDAIIEVRLLETGKESSIEETFEYELNRKGEYQSKVDHKVLPKRTYELHITFPNNNEEISAHTIIPDTFEIVSGLPDSVEYRSTDHQLEITVSESYYPGRQNIFIFNAISLAPEEENLTSEYLDIYEDKGKNPIDLKVFANNSSEIINEGNFKDNADGTYTIHYPWNSFAFYEENIVVANTIDDNVYDFVRSHDAQLGGSSLSPGEIQNVINNIKGGIGIFGAIASDSMSVYIKRPSH